MARPVLYAQAMDTWTRWTIWVCAAMLAALTGCVGEIEDARAETDPAREEAPRRDADEALPDVENDPLCRAGSSVGFSPLARLTNVQYANAVRDLLAPLDVADPGAGLVADSAVGGFRSNGSIPVSDLEFRAYAEEAARIADVVTANVDVVTGCASPADAEEEEEACVRSFVDRFVTRAYRRPLGADEVERLVSLFDQVRAEGVPFAGAVSTLVEAVLQSPQFLYRIELPDAAPGQVVALDDYQVATRLSLFLWETIPDETLLAAAEAGELRTAEQIEAHARRMLDAPQASGAIESFHLQWLGVDDMEGLEKDSAQFPEFDARLARLMRRETAVFADHVVREGDGRLETLLLGGFTFLSGDLYDLYGLEPAGTDWTRVELDPFLRPGLLTHASFLARHAHPDQTSPVHRGKVVRENLFCETLAAPPPNVADTPPDPDPELTTRERFAVHNEDPACAGCHQMMDPIGLTFEAYDPVGQHRPMEAGRPVDTSGEIVGTDVEGAIDGARELSERIYASTQARQCMVRNWYRFALGRLETGEDLCSLGEAYAAFADADFDVRELLVAITRSDAFRLYQMEDGR